MEETRVGVASNPNLDVGLKSLTCLVWCPWSQGLLYSPAYCHCCMALSWQTAPALCFSKVIICPLKDFSTSFPSAPVPAFNERPPACENTPIKTHGASCVAGQKHLTGSNVHSKEGCFLTLLSPHSSHCSSSFVGIKGCKAAECQKRCRLEQKCLDSMGQLRDWNTRRWNGSCLRQSWNDVLQLWKRSC